MGYIVPELDWLLEKSEESFDILHRKLHRFIGPEYKTVRDDCLEIQQKYKSRFSGSTANPVRMRQCELISLLVFHLGEEAAPQNRAVLLGALFHRLLRLEKQQTGLFYCTTPAWETTLYPIICDILNVNAKNHKIDALSIYTCLQSFHDYLLQVDAGNRGKLVKDRFEYIEKSETFLSELKGMIETYRSRAEPALKQYAYIHFIQSFGRLVGSIWEGKENSSEVQEKMRNFSELKFQYIVFAAFYFMLLQAEHEQTDETDAVIETCKLMLNYDASNYLNTAQEVHQMKIRGGFELMKEFITLLGQDYIDHNLDCRLWGNARKFIRDFNNAYDQIKKNYPLPEISTAQSSTQDSPETTENPESTSASSSISI